MSDKSKKKQSDGITETIDLLNKIHELQESNDSCKEALADSSQAEILNGVQEKLSEISDVVLGLAQELMDAKYSAHKEERETFKDPENFSPVMISSPSLDLR